MEAKLFSFLVALQLATLSCCSATSRALAPNNGLGVHQQQQQPSYKEADHGEVEMSKEAIGSGRPRCEHKCYGCTPCEAIQVPANTSKRGCLKVEYANYEPESWKCKCGPSFYIP